MIDDIRKHFLASFMVFAIKYAFLLQGELLRSRKRYNAYRKENGIQDEEYSICVTTLSEDSMTEAYSDEEYDGKKNLKVHVPLSVDLHGSLNLSQKRKRYAAPSQSLRSYVQEKVESKDKIVKDSTGVYNSALKRYRNSPKRAVKKLKKWLKVSQDDSFSWSDGSVNQNSFTFPDLQSSPRHIRKLIGKAESPEKLHLEIIDVDAAPWLDTDTLQYSLVTAQIHNVERSATDLHVDDTILFTTWRYVPGYRGPPEEVPKPVSKGMRVVAYLKVDEEESLHEVDCPDFNVYKLAAGGHSIDVPEEKSNMQESFSMFDDSHRNFMMCDKLLF